MSFEQNAGGDAIVGLNCASRPIDAALNSSSPPQSCRVIASAGAAAQLFTAADHVPFAGSPAEPAGDRLKCLLCAPAT